MGPSLYILSPHYVFLLRESRESFGIASTLFSKLVTSREIVLNVLFPIKPGSTGCSLCFSIDFFSVNCLDFSPTLCTSAIRKLKVGRIYRDCRHSQSITPAVLPMYLWHWYLASHEISLILALQNRLLPILFCYLSFTFRLHETTGKWYYPSFSLEEQHSNEANFIFLLCIIISTYRQVTTFTAIHGPSHSGHFPKNTP